MKSLPKISQESIALSLISDNVGDTISLFLWRNSIMDLSMKINFISLWVLEIQTIALYRKINPTTSTSYKMKSNYDNKKDNIKSKKQISLITWKIYLIHRKIMDLSVMIPSF